MFSSSQTLFTLHHKIWSSQIRTTLCEEHSESPIRQRLKLPKPLCAFWSDRDIHFGKPSSLSWSRFSILVQTIWTFRSHWVAVTACDSTSWCHRVVPLGHTDNDWVYIYPRVEIWKFLPTLHPPCPTLSPSWSPDRLHRRQWPPAAGPRRRQWDSHRCCHRSKFSAKLGYRLDTLRFLLFRFLQKDLCHYSSHIWDWSIHQTNSLEWIWCKNIGLGFRRTHLRLTDLRI